MNPFEQEMTEAEKKVETMLTRGADHFKTQATIDIESAILNKLQASKTSDAPSNQRPWRFVAVAAMIFMGISALFFYNNNIISQSEYVDDSISLFEVFEDAMKSMEENGIDMNDLTSLENNVFAFSPEMILNDIALLTYASDQIDDSTKENKTNSN